MKITDRATKRHKMHPIMTATLAQNSMCFARYHLANARGLTEVPADAIVERRSIVRFNAFVLALSGCMAALVFCCSPTATAYSQIKADISNAIPCNVDAYVIDKDPQGLNVRSGAGRNFEVIGNLPFRDYTGIGVHITGSNGDWVQIDSAVEEGAEEDRTFFKGVGWVYGPLLGLTAIAHQPFGRTPLYQQASLKSRIITSVPGGDDVTMRSCRGEWLYVEYKNMKGWAAPRTLCSNPLSTCG